jgi:hypothetical protein
MLLLTTAGFAQPALQRASPSPWRARASSWTCTGSRIPAGLFLGWARSTASRRLHATSSFLRGLGIVGLAVAGIRKLVETRRHIPTEGPAQARAPAKALRDAVALPKAGVVDAGEYEAQHLFDCTAGRQSARLGEDAPPVENGDDPDQDDCRP